MSAHVIDNQPRKSTRRSSPVSASVIVVKSIGGVVDRGKCGAPRRWNSSFHGPISSSPQVRA
jgi:hypothetical protein